MHVLLLGCNILEGFFAIEFTIRLASSAIKYHYCMETLKTPIFLISQLMSNYT